MYQHAPPPLTCLDCVVAATGILVCLAVIIVCCVVMLRAGGVL